MCYAAYEIITDYCPETFNFTGGFPSKPMKQKTLKLTRPNGNELFTAGIDTLITWECVAASDKVKLEYSIDNGINWKIITYEATGLKYVWKNIPKTISNYCLVRVNQGYAYNAPTVEWESNLGGSIGEDGKFIQQTRDGGYIVAGD